jgi:acylphosphatase
MSVRVSISGRVQGVWFRGWVSEQANRLSISGWVRNLSDGRVEAVFHGDALNVDEMVSLCWDGPRWAKVENVISAAEDVYDEIGFHVVRSV